MDIYVPEPVVPFHTALGANFNTFTTRQDVSPQPLPVINPYKLRSGTKFDIETEGEFSTTGTPTLILGYYIGTAAAAITTVIAESSAITTASGAASFPWRMRWRGMCTAVGASGSVTGNGTLEFGTSLIALSVLPIPITLALRTFTWDTTIARAIGVCATFSASSGSNNVRVYNHSVLILN
jgi:hypothetical protein